MRSLTQGTAVYLCAASLNAVVPFALLGYLARVLDAADIGKIGVFLVLVNFAGVVIGLNTHGLVSVAYFREGAKKETAAAIGSCLVIMATSLAASVLVYLLASDALATHFAIPARVLLGCMLCAAAQFVLQVVLAYLQSSGQPVRYGALTVAATTGTAVLTLWILASEPTWMARVWGQSVAATAVALCALWFVSRRLSLLSCVDRRSLGRAVKFGLPLVPHSLAVIVMSGYDRVYVGQYISAAAAGEYFAAAQVASVIQFGAVAVNQALMPWVFAKLATGTHAGKLEVVRLCRRLAFLALAVAFLVAVCADPLITTVFGLRYEGAAPLLVYLAPSVGVGCLYFVASNFLFFAEKTGALPLVTCAAALVQLVLIHLLGKPMGAMGVACAVLVSQCVFVAGVWWLAQRALPMPWGSFRE